MIVHGGKGVPHGTSTCEGASRELAAIYCEHFRLLQRGMGLLEFAPVGERRSVIVGQGHAKLLFRDRGLIRMQKQSVIQV